MELKNGVALNNGKALYNGVVPNNGVALYNGTIAMKQFTPKKK